MLLLESCKIVGLQVLLRYSTFNWIREGIQSLGERFWGAEGCSKPISTLKVIGVMRSQSDRDSERHFSWLFESSVRLPER